MRTLVRTMARKDLVRTMPADHVQRMVLQAEKVHKVCTSRHFFQVTRYIICMYRTIVISIAGLIVLAADPIQDPVRRLASETSAGVSPEQVWPIWILLDFGSVFRSMSKVIRDRPRAPQGGPGDPQGSPPGRRHQPEAFKSNPPLRGV